MAGTTTRLVSGILVIIVGLVLLPVLTGALNPVTQENRFICSGNATGSGAYSAYCTQNPFRSTTTLTGAYSLGTSPSFTSDSANEPALTGNGLGFSQAATAVAAAASAAQSGPVVWAPTTGTATISLLQILPLVFTIGLIVGGIYQFVQVARERM